MAGHFVLNSITVSDLTTAQMKGCAWSALQHVGGTARPNPPGGTYPGWTQVGQVTLAAALGPAGIGARDNLPPHRYLQFGPIQEGHDPFDYIRGAGWADSVKRPPSMGLRQLADEAQAAWNAGNAGRAVFLQARHGQVSVEVYYLAGSLMS
jgi:hypothetical protein